MRQGTPQVAVWQGTQQAAGQSTLMCMDVVMATESIATAKASWPISGQDTDPLSCRSAGRRGLVHQRVAACVRLGILIDFMSERGLVMVAVGVTGCDFVYQYT